MANIKVMVLQWKLDSEVACGPFADMEKQGSILCLESLLGY